MKKSEAFLNTTHRSFIKKSIVASVAASNLTMFSGLANASCTSPSMSGSHQGCSIDIKRERLRTFRLNPPSEGPIVTKNTKVVDCELTGCKDDVYCGVYPKLKSGEENVYQLDENGDFVTERVKAFCDGDKVTCLMDTWKNDGHQKVS